MCVNSRAQGYMHQCTIPANAMNLVIFDLGKWAKIAEKAEKLSWQPSYSWIIILKPKPSMNL